MACFRPVVSLMATGLLVLTVSCGTTEQPAPDRAAVSDLSMGEDRVQGGDAAGGNDPGPDLPVAPDATQDGGADALADAPSGADAAADGTADTGSDAPSDLPFDAPVDAPIDAPIDAPADAPADMTADASGDAVDGGGPAITPVGTPIGAPTSATIGPAGGTLASSDGRVVLTVPAGALAASTLITIQPVTGEAPLHVGAGYDLLPNGLVFLQPATLTLTYTDAEMDGIDPTSVGLAYQDSLGQWTSVGYGAVDSTARTIAVPVAHFTPHNYYATCKARAFQQGSRNVMVLGYPAKLLLICTRNGTTYTLLEPEVPSDVMNLTWFVSDGGGDVVQLNSPFPDYQLPASRPSQDPVTITAVFYVNTLESGTSMYMAKTFPFLLEKDWRIQFDTTNAVTTCPGDGAKWSLTCSGLSTQLTIDANLNVTQNGASSDCANMLSPPVTCPTYGTIGGDLGGHLTGTVTGLSGTVDPNTATMTLSVMGHYLALPHLFYTSNNATIDTASDADLPSPIAIPQTLLYNGASHAIGTGQGNVIGQVMITINTL
jgi:hypothetical protein